MCGGLRLLFPFRRNRHADIVIQNDKRRLFRHREGGAYMRIGKGDYAP